MVEARELCLTYPELPHSFHYLITRMIKRLWPKGLRAFR